MCNQLWDYSIMGNSLDQHRTAIGTFLNRLRDPSPVQNRERIHLYSNHINKEQLGNRLLSSKSVSRAGGVLRRVTAEQTTPSREGHKSNKSW
jgi:hypothetical protein